VRPFAGDAEVVHGAVGESQAVTKTTAGFARGESCSRGVSGADGTHANQRVTGEILSDFDLRLQECSSKVVNLVTRNDSQLLLGTAAGSDANLSAQELREIISNLQIGSDGAGFFRDAIVKDE